MSDMSVNRTPIAPRIIEQSTSFHPNIENQDLVINKPSSVLKGSTQLHDMRASESSHILPDNTPQMIKV